MHKLPKDVFQAFAFLPVLLFLSDPVGKLLLILQNHTLYIEKWADTTTLISMEVFKPQDCFQLFSLVSNCQSFPIIHSVITFLLSLAHKVVPQSIQYKWGRNSLCVTFLCGQTVIPQMWPSVYSRATGNGFSSTLWDWLFSLNLAIKKGVKQLQSSLDS